MSLQMGVGTSSQADIVAAGHEAAEQMVAHLAGRKPDLIMVFSSIRFADPRMLKAVRSVTGAAPLIGCTDSGGIVTAGPKRRAVTVIGFVASQGAFVTGVERHLSHHPRDRGEHFAQSLLAQKSQDPRCLMVFPDGLSVSGSPVLDGIDKKVSPSVPVVGATAADDLHFQRTFQYYNDEVLTDSMPGVLMCGDIGVGVGVHHGWVPVGRPRHVTSASRNIVYQLDGRPAVSIYEDFLGLKREELMQEPLAAMTLTYPLGTEIHGQPEYLLRDAIRVGRGGSLVCMADVVEGSDVRLMIGGYESALEAAQQAARDAVDRLRPKHLTGALVFCSVARQKMLGSEFQGEIDVIRDALGGVGVRLGGFYSYGELAPAPRLAAGRKVQDRLKRMLRLFHNESVVVVALG